MTSYLFSKGGVGPADAQQSLYPPIEPFDSGRLVVDGGHEIYYEQCGNPAGRPVLVVHGGPGGGCGPLMRRYHDAAVYRIILFDQRGCGRSTPHASIENNTTWDLVADIERLRRHLEIETWQLFGGSWGATLSLTYAIAHPERVDALILRGIFLFRAHEISWFYRGGCGQLFPEAYDAFLSVIPEDEREDIIEAYRKRLMDPNPSVHLPAAKAWSVWEGSTLSLLANESRIKAFTANTYALAFARIECHYFVNNGFFDDPNHILNQIDRIRHIPAVIVHGRYDVITPARNAWDLHQTWPESDLRIVPVAGHAMSEPGIQRELVAATKRFAT